MEKKDFLNIYIEHWNKASDFLDKAILTLSTSILWLTTISNIQNKVNDSCLFLLGVGLIFVTLVLVLLSYIISIYNSQLWIKYFDKLVNKNEIVDKIKINNKIINYFRYIYVLTTICWILLLLISLLKWL